jgi:hypothetical protein
MTPPLSQSATRICGAKPYRSLFRRAENMKLYYLRENSINGVPGMTTGRLDITYQTLYSELVQRSLDESFTSEFSSN